MRKFKLRVIIFQFFWISLLIGMRGQVAIFPISKVKGNVEAFSRSHDMESSKLMHFSCEYFVFVTGAEKLNIAHVYQKSRVYEKSSNNKDHCVHRISHCQLYVVAVININDFFSLLAAALLAPWLCLPLCLSIYCFLSL